MTDTPQTPADQEEDEISLLDLLQTIVDNLRLLVLGPLAVGLLVLCISFAIPPSYTARAQFLPPQQQQSAAAGLLQSLGGLGGLAGAATGIKNPADQYIAFLRSNSVKDSVIDRFKLMDRWGLKSTEQARARLSGVRFSSGKDGLMSIEVDDVDPQFAANLANSYVDALRQLLGRLAVTEAQQRRIFFERQLTQTKEKLIAAEQALKAAGISDSLLKSNPTSAVAGIATLKAQVTAQEVKVGAMRGYLTESAPDFKQAITELVSLRTQLAKQEQTTPAGSDDRQNDYISRYREYKYNETLFELFAKQYEVARVDEAREGAMIQVLDPAEPPENRSKPKKAQMAITATLLAGVVLLVYIFVRKFISKASMSDETSRKLDELRAGLRKAMGR